MYIKSKIPIKHAFRITENNKFAYCKRCNLYMRIFSSKDVIIRCYNCGDILNKEYLYGDIDTL